MTFDHHITRMRYNGCTPRRANVRGADQEEGTSPMNVIVRTASSAPATRGER